MTSAISQLVYMPNFRAIGQSVWEKNGNRQTDRNTDLNFVKRDTCFLFISMKFISMAKIEFEKKISMARIDFSKE